MGLVLPEQCQELEGESPRWEGKIKFELNLKPEAAEPQFFHAGIIILKDF